MGPTPRRLVSLQEEEIRTQISTEGIPCEDRGRRRQIEVKERDLRREASDFKLADTLISDFQLPEL